MQVVRKLISVSESVAAELDKEPNASALVDVLLGDFYGVEVVEFGKGGNARDEIKARLGNADVTANPGPSPEEQAQALALANIEEVVQPIEEAPVAVPVPVSVVEAAPVPEPVVEPVPEPEPAPSPTEVPLSTAPVAEQPSVLEEVPVVEPVEPAPVDPPAVEPEPETAPTELPINVNNVPGGYCEIHGVYAGNICIDCL